ncbi:MAG: lipocalin family protein [Bacteroidales bacterium]|nr:lipocalin family protein [Bacteroidales bacterium]
MKKLLLFAIAIAALASCGGGKSKNNPVACDSDSVATDSFPTLEGTWLRPVADSVKGFTLSPDMTARAINSPGTVMKKWSIKGDSLTIDAEIKTADTIIDTTLKFRIESLRGDTLCLISGDSFTIYTRQK